MKTLRFFGMALFAVLMCVNFAACSNEEVISAEPQKGKEIVVSLSLKGEYEVSESPLSRAASNDLYYIWATDKTNSSTKYAVGLFNDVSTLNITLIEGNTYRFDAMIIKDGMTKLAQTEGVFGKPFSNIALNTEGFTYSNNWEQPDYTEFKLTDGNTYGIPNLDIWQGGITQDYVATEGEDVTIQTVRASFGAKFVAKNLTEGSLKVSLRGTGVGANNGMTMDSPTFELTQEYENTDQIFLMPMLETSTTQSRMVYATLSVICTWVKANGDEVELGSPTITFERNKKTTIYIKVVPDVENGITFTTTDSEEMGDGGTYNVEDGTATVA